MLRCYHPFQERRRSRWHDVPALRPALCHHAVQFLSRAASTSWRRRRSPCLPPRSIKWSVLHIDRYLLEEADKQVKKLKGQGKRILCIWDGSVIEKPESSKIEGLCPVVSSKAKRLHRSKKGLVFNFPPKKAITVTGMQWTGALIDFHGRYDKSCVDELVDNERRICHKTERARRSTAEKVCEAVGRYSASHL